MGIARFHGTYNASKAKVFLVLRDIPRLRLTSGTLASQTGVPLASLRTLLPKWCRWGRIRRTKLNGEGVYYYQLTQKGREWLSRWEFMMPVKQYYAEMLEYRQRKKHIQKTRYLSNP